jgi:phage host-nuclease inhibitor protein Gam
MRSASSAAAGNTAPALIGVQDLFASVAEANTAATAAFLATSATGTEDRINRNLYQDAIRRASEQAEEVSAIIGSDDDAHRALKDINVALNTYSGQIEAARIANINGLPEADEQLRRALRLVQDDVGTSVATVTERGRSKLAEERTTGRFLTWIAIGLGVVTLAALLRVQVALLARTNRIVNPLLVVATMLIATVVGYLVVGPAVRAQSLDSASTGGYDAIATTSAIQTAAFELQSQLSLKILEGADDDLEPLYDEVAANIARLEAGADSDREEAAARALQIRWERYETAARGIEARAEAGPATQSGTRDQAVELFQGDGLSAFNGLNTAVESALSDNRSQFLTGVARASDAVSTTPYLTIILPVLAALAIMLAIQRRLGEYR